MFEELLQHQAFVFLTGAKNIDWHIFCMLLTFSVLNFQPYRLAAGPERMMKVIFPSVQFNSSVSEKLCNVIRLNWGSLWSKCQMQFADDFPQEQQYPFLTVDGVFW